MSLRPSKKQIKIHSFIGTILKEYFIFHLHSLHYYTYYTLSCIYIMFQSSIFTIWRLEILFSSDSKVCI